MRIAVVTICTPNLNFGSYCIKNSKEYCDRHGYDFILYDKKIDENISAVANKTLTVLDNIDKYDWILMKDADSLFYNFNYSLDDYTDDYHNYFGSWSKIPTKINLGHILIRCTPQVKDELEMVFEEVQKKVKLKGEQPIYNRFWDEGRISPIKKLPKHIFNAHAYGTHEWNNGWFLKTSWDMLKEMDNQNLNLEQYNDIKKDTLIVHYPGTFLKTRSYVAARKVIETGIEDFNFVGEGLLSYVMMYDNIVKINKGVLPTPSPKRKKMASNVSVMLRSDRTKMKKINYKK